MLIRPRRDNDADALERIALRTHELDGYPVYLPEDLKSFIVEAGAMDAWVAVGGGEVLGHVALHTSSAPEIMEVVFSETDLEAQEIAMVARLLVDPSTRRQGVGRALLEKATAEAARLGRRAVLDVVEDHRAAIALYDECGWTRVGSVDWELPGGLPLREFVYVSPASAT